LRRHNFPPQMLATLVLTRPAAQASYIKLRPTSPAHFPKRTCHRAHLARSPRTIPHSLVELQGPSFHRRGNKVGRAGHRAPRRQSLKRFLAGRWLQGWVCLTLLWGPWEQPARRSQLGGLASWRNRSPPQPSAPTHRGPWASIQLVTSFACFPETRWCSQQGSPPRLRLSCSY
jgi:hypothetical protein